MKSKWLEDVIEATGLDYDEVVEHIERERKMMYVHSRPHLFV